MKQWIMMLVLVLMVLGWQGCGGEEDPGVGEKVILATGLEVQGYFLERIGGSLIDYRVIVPEGESAEWYEPTEEQKAMFSEVRLFLCIGAPFEEAFITDIKQTYTTLMVADMRRTGEQVSMGQFGQARTRGDEDSFIWMDPVQAEEVVAENTAGILSWYDPRNRMTYLANLDLLKADLGLLRTEMAAVMEPLKGQTFFAYQAAFGHFANRYEMTQEVVEIVDPTNADEISAIVEQAKAAGVKLIFMPAGVPDATVSQMATDIDGAVVAIDPTGRDYLGNMQKIVAALK